MIGVKDPLNLDAPLVILLGASADMLRGTVDVIDAGSGASVGSFRVEVVDGRVLVDPVPDIAHPFDAR